MQIGIWLDRFQVYLREHVGPKRSDGSRFPSALAKSPMHAVVAKQHRPSVVGNALSNLVERGVGPAEHIHRATALKHPFHRDTPLELDLHCNLVAPPHAADVQQAGLSSARPD